MNVSARDRDEGPLISAMRHQIHITEMPEPRRLPRVLTARIAVGPRLLVGGATAVAGAATVAVLTIGAATTATPAFAATSNPNGTVTITLDDLTGVSGLNAKLASMGVAIRAVPVVSGCTATAQVVGADGTLQPAGTLAVSPLPNNPRTGSQSTLDTITVTPPQTPGQTEILAASTSGVDLLGQTARAAPEGSFTRPALDHQQPETRSSTAVGPQRSSSALTATTVRTAGAAHSRPFHPTHGCVTGPRRVAGAGQRTGLTDGDVIQYGAVIRCRTALLRLRTGMARAAPPSLPGG